MVVGKGRSRGNSKGSGIGIGRGRGSSRYKGRSRVHKGMQVSCLPLHTQLPLGYQASLCGCKRHHKRKVL